MLFTFDDIVVFSETFEDHCEHLHLVLTALMESGLQANVNKCKFFLSQFKVRRLVSGKGIAPDPGLLEAMARYPVPDSRAKVRSFLALINYLS